MPHGPRPVHPGEFVVPDKYDVLFNSEYQFTSPPASNVSGPGSDYGPGGNYNADFEKWFGPYFDALKSGGMAAVGGRPGALSPGAKVAAWDAMQIYGPEYLAKQGEWQAGVDAYDNWTDDPSPEPAPVPDPGIAPPLPPGPIEPPTQAPPQEVLPPGQPEPGPTAGAPTGATEEGDIRTGVRRTRRRRVSSALEQAGENIGLPGGGSLERPRLVGRVRSALGLG